MTKNLGSQFATNLNNHTKETHILSLVPIKKIVIWKKFLNQGQNHSSGRHYATTEPPSGGVGGYFH
jgi:hypothetical protein